MFAMRFKSLEPNPQTLQPEQRLFSKVDELCALETFRELKKGLDEEKQVSKDCELAFGTEQKALLLKCMDSIQWSITDIEHKISVSEKLK